MCFALYSVTGIVLVTTGRRSIRNRTGHRRDSPVPAALPRPANACSTHPSVGRRRRVAYDPRIVPWRRREPSMSVVPTAIEGLLVVRWPTHDDDRGFFRQTHQQDELAVALGHTPRFVQSNHARSRPGVVRGFHVEPWDKLVYVVRGTARCAVADVRSDSPTFGEVATFLLGDPPGERLRLYLAEGLANAYAVVGDGEVDYLYDVTAMWTPDADRRVYPYDDPDLGVDWGIDAPIVSEVDAAGLPLRAQHPERFGA